MRKPPTRTEEIIAACRAGEKHTYIAALFDITPAAVSMAAKRAGIPKRSTGPAKKPPRSFAQFMRSKKRVIKMSHGRAECIRKGFPTLKWLAMRLNSPTRANHGARGEMT